MALLLKNATLPHVRTECPCYHVNTCWATAPPCGTCSDHPFPCELIEEVAYVPDDHRRDDKG